MNLIRKTVAGLALTVLLPWGVSAQVEKITDAVYRDQLEALPQLIEAAKNPYLKEHLSSLKPETMEEKAFVTAVRVAADLNCKVNFAGKVARYAVPAMSEMMRLPEVYPLDGKALAPVRIRSPEGLSGRVSVSVISAIRTLP